MNRSVSIAFSVILGAIAMAIAVVPYYVLANRDRHMLATDLEAAKARASAAENEQARIAEEANDRVHQANTEVERAQQVIQAMKADEEIKSRAIRLSKPGSRELVGWTGIVSIPQRTSLMVPPRNTLESDTAYALRVSTAYASGTRGTPWLEVFPYDVNGEQRLLDGIASGTEVAYVVGDTLLIGTKGTRLDTKTPEYILRVREEASSTHLVVVTELPQIGKTTVMRVLGTLGFE